MKSSYKPFMVKLVDDVDAAISFVEIVYNSLYALADQHNEAWTALVKKSHNDRYEVPMALLQQIASRNLIRFNGILYPDIRAIVKTLTLGQTNNFRPVIPASIIMAAA